MSTQIQRISTDRPGPVTAGGTLESESTPTVGGNIVDAQRIDTQTELELEYLTLSQKEKTTRHARIDSASQTPNDLADQQAAANKQHKKDSHELNIEILKLQEQVKTTEHRCAREKQFA